MISGVKVNGFHLLLYSIALRTLSLSPLHFVQLDNLHNPSCITCMIHLF